jgi:23S rRNA (adenine2503-C2)-methyltransferase
VDTRIDIHSLSREQIAEAFSALGLPRFRSGQVVHWLYGRGATSFDSMSDLPSSLREELSARYRLGGARVTSRQVSADGTRKYLVSFDDGTSVETVGLPDGDRLTVCFSTQAGCAMGCTFCATGRAGFTRNLTCGEMVRQVLLVADDFGRRVSNAVAMGQGEPFANYDATLTALRFMNSEDGPGIGARHITVSSCGILAGIRRFSEEPEQFTLAVSLHSAVQATRDRLMPGVRGVSIAALRGALVAYAERTGRRPTLEYALAAGVNDTDAELRALVSFARGMLAHVNLIPVNPVAEAGLARSVAERVRLFRDTLLRAGIETSVRVERGTDIDAACGQLRQRHER